MTEDHDDVTRNHDDVTRNHDDVTRDHGGVTGDHDALSAYLDGELGDAERRAVEARLAGSDALRAELAEVRSVREAVRRLPEPEPPAGFWESVVARVRAAEAEDGARAAAAPAATVRSLDARRRHPRAAWMGAAAAVVAVGVAVVVLPGRRVVRPDVTTVAVQHGASSAAVVDPLSALIPVGPTVEPRR